MNPCVTCGACCAHSRVSFHQSELATHGGRTPADLTLPRPIPEHHYLRGTDGPAPRCVALAGDVGVVTRCTIYEDRPSVCRGVEPAWKGGVPSAWCDAARARHGLAPLDPGWDYGSGSSPARIIPS